MAADNKRIAKNSIFMYIRMGVTVLVGFYTSRVILQVLGVQDYGIYNAVGGIVALFTFLNTAMTQATQRFLSYELGKGDMVKLRNTFSMCLNVHILISIIIVAIGEALGLWLLYNKMVIPADRMHIAFWVFQLSILASVINVTQVPYNASLYAHERFNVYAVFQVGKAFLLLGSVFSLKLIPFDKLLTYAVLVFICNLLFALVNRVYDIKQFSECHYKCFWDKGMFRNVMGYTSWSLIGNMSTSLCDQGINILLNIFFGPVVNAARGIAVQVQTAIASLVFNFQGASVPQIVKLYASGDRNGVLKLVNNSSKISFYLFYIMVVPVCFEMNKLLTLWLGQVHDYMVAFSIFTLVIIVCQAFGGTLVFLIQATGKIKGFQIFSSIANALVFPITYVFFKLGFDPITPFIVIMIARLIIDIYTFYDIKKLVDYPINVYYKNVLLPEFIISALGLIAPSLYIIYMEDTIIRCVLLFISCILINSLLIYYIGFNKHEREWIKNLISKNVLKFKSSKNM